MAMPETLESTPPRRWPVASEHSLWARTMLAFLATAGLFYVNIMPALVDGLMTGLSFSQRDAGLVGSLNVYGAAAGALAAVWLVKRLAWRPLSYGLLLALLVLDLGSMLLQSSLPLMALRFLHGVVGGLLVGVGFAVIARTHEPDKTFGVLLLVQFGLGGLGVMYLPRLVPVYGTPVLFAALVAFTLVTLMMVPFLAAYDTRSSDSAKTDTPATIAKGPLLLTLLALFLFQGANMGLYAYIIPLADAALLESEFTSRTLGQAAWIGILGSGLVVAMSTRFGRAWPLGLAITTTAIATWALNYSDQASIFWLANLMVGITWAFTIPYLLGMASAFDQHGQMAALGGFASKMGLASGPMAAALLVGDGNYPLLIGWAVIALVLCLVAAVLPARQLDQA
ncbi:MFS transporter [Ferrimonas marina]|uniref:Predicted arabinose efflux permease, MFS family n=1 Tax=Ferrimonas marina TaxID=299255 RepID=A0A1M5X6Q2_9GAMM|nr:MFS transporter [Ferrimonas marina]SHH95469.1 Predicted arabinose efflux permease, MFS family [Ferrimonas marina]